MDEGKLIKKASNGNGGVFSSMDKNGILEEMQSKGTKWIFIGGVDNVLSQMVDLNLIGLAIKNGTKIAAKSVLKTSPKEKAGVFCKQNGKIKIIEYTEIPKELAEETKKNGELVFGEMNIIANLFSIEAIEKASKKDMPYHVAFKKASFINEKNELILPTEPKCYKFEKFIFDSFALFDEISILRGKREEDFAPIKNKERRR